MSDIVTRLRTSCSPESPLGKLCSEAADLIAGMGNAPKPVKTLRQYLLENGLTQTKFCGMIEMSPVVLSQVLNGHKRPGLRFIARISEATNGEVNVHSWMPHRLRRQPDMTPTRSTKPLLSIKDAHE